MPPLGVRHRFAPALVARLPNAGIWLRYNFMMSADHREPPSSPEQEARDRRAANIFLLVAGAVLVAIGIWLANAMVDARRADECLSSGRRNCAPIEAPQR